MTAESLTLKRGRAAAVDQSHSAISAGTMRMLAIHSIELNLFAYLLLQGEIWPAIRKMGHDLTARLDSAMPPWNVREHDLSRARRESDRTCSRGGTADGQAASTRRPVASRMRCFHRASS